MALCISRRRARSAAAAALTLTVVAALAACSGSSSSSGTGATGTAAAGSSSSTAAPIAARPDCAPPAAGGTVAATPVAGVPSDWTLTSFDGTKIRVHWFPLASAAAAKASPTILMGPGWGSGGDTNTTTTGSQGVTSIKDLRGAGYNVLTWDPRGFGVSTGRIEVDSAAAEGRDVEQIISWLATRPGVELDAAGDPRIGMVGASYGGGIQLTTAAIDCRVDAIVPSWAWHSLTTSLDKATTPKSGWATLLYGAAAGRNLDPHIVSANRSSAATGTIDATDTAWFAQRGPADAVKQIKIPTLFVQGTVDTLFTLDEAVRNYEILRSAGVPTAMLWFCGGHGVCLTDPGDRARVEQKTLLWLAKYVKGDATVDTGPGFELVDQNGTTYTADHYPLAAGTPITADGRGTLSLVATGGAGPATVPASNPDLLGRLVGPITPARATNAVNVDVATGTRAAVIAGAPVLRLTYHGSAAAGPRPERVFAQLVDAATGIVLGNQITPIAVTLDGATHTTTVPLEMVAYTTKPGSKLVLQIVATTVAYAQPRLEGSIEMVAHLELPVAANLTPR